jgi:hypothetical protein
MRTVVVIALLASAAVADACPWTRHYCPPGPVIVYPYCPPPVVRFVEAKPPETKPAVVKEDVAPDGWCHIRGRVVYDGDPLPVQKLIPRSGGAYTEDWVVNATNRGVKNVVVWLVPELSNEQVQALKDRKLREVPSFRAKDVYPGLTEQKEVTVLIPEKPIALVPHVAIVRAGSDVVFRNASTRPENVKWVSVKNGEFNPLLPPNFSAFRIDQAKTERLPIGVEASIHPWMKAYVWVLDHPYFAVTDDDGNFEIRFAPKGNLRLVVWQETTGFRGGREGRWGEAVRVPSGRLDLGEIKLKPPAKD